MFCVTYISSIFHEMMMLMYLRGRTSIHTDRYCIVRKLMLIYIVSLENQRLAWCLKELLLSWVSFYFSTLVYLSRCLSWHETCAVKEWAEDQTLLCLSCCVLNTVEGLDTRAVNTVVMAHPKANCHCINVVSCRLQNI